MAEPQQEGSIVPREGTGGELAQPMEPQSILVRFGLGKEPSAAAPYLRAILAGLKEAGSAQLGQIPIVGPLLAGAGATLLELSAEEDDAVFEERIAEILDSGRRTGESLEILTALSSAIYLQQGFLLDCIESQGMPAQREKLANVALSTALAAYRGRVARDYQYADYRGIEGGARAEHAASLSLDQVYVLPRLVSERSRIDSREREGQLLKDLLDNEDLAPGERAKLEEEFAVLTGERWRALKKGEQGLPVGEALGSTRHAVVIGSPGVGKSALTRFLARTCALGGEAVREKLGWSEDLTPIVLPLAAYADARSRTSGLTLREHLDNWLEARGGEALQEAVANELQAGRVFILFDGVDEIPDSRERVLIVKAVEQFLGDHDTNRIFVTSRPYGYVPLAGEIPHYRLPNFSPDQVKDFVERWQRVFECWRHPDAPDLAKAGQQAKEMLEEIRRNPKVEDLATNPLMLMIFALIRHEQARLPEERVQLYDRAVKTLMDSWNRGRCLAGIDVGGARLSLDRLVRVWGTVAEWTRRTKPTGVVYRAELKIKLVEILRNEELDDEDPWATAESYLNAAADRAGLLEERGKDIFAFWHPTFEEFLAAVDLTTPSSQALQRILPLRDDPRWREVIFLSVGYLGVVQRDQGTATELVRAIWQDLPTPLEPVLHGHLRLALACAVDSVGIKRSLIEEIVLALGIIASEHPYKPFLSCFVQAIRSFPHLRPSPSTISELESLFSHRDKYVRMGIARLAGNVAAHNREALRACGWLLRDWDVDVRCHAAFGLVRAGVHSVEVWSALAGFRSESAGIRQLVEAWLSSAWLSSATNYLSFLRPLLADSDPELRWSAASLWCPLGGDREGALMTLLPLLISTDCSSDLRGRAADVWKSVGGDPDLVWPFLEGPMSGSNQERCLAAVKVWISIRGDINRSLSALEPILFSPDLLLRWQAANLWWSIDGDAAPLLAALEPLVAISNQSLLRKVAELWRWAGGDVERIWITLEPWLTSSDTNSALKAAEVWRSAGGEAQRILSILEPFLEIRDPESIFRVVVAWWLAGGDEERVRPPLGRLLESTDEKLRRRAARRLLRGDSIKGMEILAESLTLEPAACLGTLRRLASRQSIEPFEGQQLADLLSTKSNGVGEERATREAIFDWIYAHLEPSVRTPSLV